MADNWRGEVSSCRIVIYPSQEVDGHRIRSRSTEGCVCYFLTERNVNQVYLHFSSGDCANCCPPDLYHCILRNRSGRIHYRDVIDRTPCRIIGLIPVLGSECQITVGVVVGFRSVGREIRWEVSYSCRQYSRFNCSEWDSIRRVEIIDVVGIVERIAECLSNA